MDALHQYNAPERVGRLGNFNPFHKGGTMCHKCKGKKKEEEKKIKNPTDGALLMEEARRWQAQRAAAAKEGETPQKKQ